MTSTFPKMFAERTAREEESTQAFRRVYEHVKREIPVVDAADLLCGPAGQRTGLRQVGGRWTGCCPLPDHDDKTPSFVLYPANVEGDRYGGGSWYCFGCLRGGDVIDLWRESKGMSSSWEAVVGLSSEFGVDLPERSGGWKDARSRRDRMRHVHTVNLSERMAKRTFSVYAMPAVRQIPDEADREETLRAWWETWNRKLPFYAWASAMIARCEERAKGWSGRGESDGE